MVDVENNLNEILLLIIKTMHMVSSVPESNKSDNMYCKLMTLHSHSGIFRINHIRIINGNRFIFRECNSVKIVLVPS